MENQRFTLLIVTHYNRIIRKMKSKIISLFLLVFIFAFVIRIYRLTTYPEGFEQTEAAFGYNAYSLLKTGRDEYSKFLPLILKSVGDYKLSGYSYWQIPFIALFDLNEFSVRLSAVVASIISLLLIYLIIFQLFKKNKIALLTVFFVGISPWHIIMSRMGYDPIVAFMWYFSSLALFIQWYKSQRLYLLILSVLTLSFGTLTYYAIWVITPFTLTVYWLCIYRKLIKRIRLLYLTLILLFPLLIMSMLLFITQGQRLYQDSTFQIDAYPLLLEQIREDQHEFPLFIVRFFHNKISFYPQFILRTLFNNLSFDFLFLNGDKIDRRFYIPYNGVLYIFSAPFILLGFLYFWKYHSFPKNLFIIGSIFFIFLGSSFSQFGSEAERTLLAAPFFCFLASYGLITVSAKMRKNYIFTIFVGSVSILLIWNMTYFNHQYYWHGNVHQPWGRNYGMKDMISSLPSFKNKYQKIIFPDNVYIFFYFYNKVDPKIAWKEATTTNIKANFIGLKLRSLIGDYMTMPIECPAAGKLNVLYVCQGTKIPKNSKIIKIIRYRDNQPAFIFVEFIPTETTTLLPENIRFMEKYGLVDEADSVYWKIESEVN